MTLPYCTYHHVRAICDTDITNAEITEIIEEVDAFMDMKLNTASLSVPVLRGISRRWAAITCFTKDPTIEALGEYRGDRSYSLEKLNKELKDLIKIADGGVAFSYSYESVPRSYRATG